VIVCRGLACALGLAALTTACSSAPAGGTSSADAGSDASGDASGDSPSEVATDSAADADANLDATTDGADAAGDAVANPDAAGCSGISRLAPGSMLTGVAVDTTSVYFTQACGAFACAMRIPKSGGTPVELGSAGMWPVTSGIAVDATSVYFSTGYGDMLSVPLAGGSPVTLGTLNGPVVDVAAGATSVYGLASGMADGGCGGGIGSVPKTGGGAATQIGYACFASGLAVDSSAAYWCAQGILEATPVQPPAISVQIGQCYPGTSVVADSTSVYSQTGSLAIASVPKTGGTATTLVAQSLASPTAPLALDATDLYWASSNAIMKVPKAGGTPVTVAVPAQASALAVDDTNVYWIDSAGLGLMTAAKSCSTCVQGASCTPPANLCDVGTMDCSHDTCVDTGQWLPGIGSSTTNGCIRQTLECNTSTGPFWNTTYLPNGTTCGTNAVCIDGECGYCVSGASCTPASSCHAGTTDCSTGYSTCIDTGAVLPDLAACGTAGACCSGSCVPAGDNCGACGHSCLGSTCTEPNCDPAILQFGQVASGIASDGTNVYWTSNSGGIVSKCAAASCGSTIVTLATGTSPESVAVDASHVYWTDSGAGTVMSCPLAGCGGAPATLYSGATGPSGIATDGASVYWTNASNGVVAKCPLTGCGGSPPTVLATGTAPAGIAVGSGYAVWTDHGAGKVMTCATGGCGGSPTQLAAGQVLTWTNSKDGVAWSLAVAGGTAYWPTDTAIVGCSLSGCSGAPFVVAAGQYPAWVTADATGLYWYDDTAGGDVWTCPLGGCGASPTLLASGYGTGVLAVDATRIYFSSANQLWWMAK
jgi:hypothetical protein